MNIREDKGTDALLFIEQQLAEDEALRKEWDTLQPEYEAARALINLRLNKGLSQKELSAVTGINQADISKIERGTRNPTVKLLGRIADALGMDLSIRFVPRNRQY
ncbi:MAG: helix-turn-helix transcriptional regulator [Solobacterium sp.]|nr:helix-turn-helix transcriptional regulator [Solobacterium sp.]